MAADEAGEKTEPPTARKLQEARDQGQVPRSTDLTAAVSLLTGLMLLKVFGLDIFETMLALTRGLGEAGDISGSLLKTQSLQTVKGAVRLLAPFLALLVLFTGLGTLVQSKGVLSWKKLTPSLDKLNPLKGFKRLFSLDSLTRLGMGLLKMTFVVLVAFYTIRAKIEPVLNAGAIPARGAFNLACDVVFTLALRLVLALLILALLDYLYQRWSLYRRVKMTKQEVNDELNGYIDRVVEGYPLRGFDAIHLASAMVIHERFPEDFVFACFDGRLVRAAQSEGLETFPPTSDL